MRIYEKKLTYPELGTIRTKTVFLWFPRKLDGVTRWLEVATMEERYEDVSTYYCRGLSGWICKHWTDLESK